MESNDTFLERQRRASPAARQALAAEEVRHEVARILKIAPSAIDADRPLRELGLTSASSTELRATVSAWMGRTYASSLVFNHPTVRALASKLVSDAAPEGSQTASSAASPAPAVHPPLRGGPIAIVGMALRLPGGASSPEALWTLLSEGRDAVSEVPADRWDAARLYHPDMRAKGRMHTRWGAFVEDIAAFDAELFNLSPREAQSMDPQQRILLELTWEALEHAGTSRSRMMGSPTGVFLGIMNNNEYARRKGVDSHLESVSGHTSTSDATSIAAGRISYFFGFHGPAVSIDTACSSSLVALHLAAQSIRAGDCRAAVVAGVNLIAHPTTTLSFAKTRMLSPTGSCKTFDASADGYVRGEGGCVLVLKPLEDAIADDDHILALLRGSAVNQDGRSSGLTAPNGSAQEVLLRRALAQAGVEPSEVSYVEAHGTGTPLGDPIEVHALSQVFASRANDNPLAVGSIKANMGHLEACAGLASVAKVIVAMQRREITRQIHLTKLNPRLAMPPWLVVPLENRPWQPPGGRRIAGVSSFGFSGTNAHVILEEAPAVDQGPPTTRLPGIVCLSGATGDALRRMARSYLAELDSTIERSAQSIAATAYASSRREHLAFRAAAVAGSTDELRRQLEALAEGVEAEGLFSTEAGLEEPAVGFLFPDLGARASVAPDLYRTEPDFRNAVDRCATAVGASLDAPLSEIVRDGAPESLRHPRSAFVAGFAVQYGLVEMWRAWGIVPGWVLGSGLGEVAAACAAGTLDLDGAVSLLLGCGEIFEARRAGIVDPESQGSDLEALASSIERRRARLSFVSSATGAVALDAPAEASYWRRLLLEPTSADLAAMLRSAGCNVILTLDRTTPAHVTTTLARLHVQGLNVSWQRFYDGRVAGYRPLPRYAFCRRPYWIADQTWADGGEPTAP